MEFWIEETSSFEPRGITRSIESVRERRAVTCSREVKYAILSGGMSVSASASEMILTSNDEVWIDSFPPFKIAALPSTFSLIVIHVHLT